MNRWGEKRYHSMDYDLKELYGEKVYKITLNGGMTCPNRDGKVGHGGCIFCSAAGSGDFAGSATCSITEQLVMGKENLIKKRPVHSYIAYFQAYTNTYAPVSYLRPLFMEAILHPDIVVLSVATRPDCITPEILTLLSELNEIKPVWIEFGLQTIHDETAAFIRREFSLSCYEQAVAELKHRNIAVVTHVILGLPGETTEQILETVDYVAHSGISGVKLQLLHVLSDTDLADYYAAHPFPLFSMEEYCDFIVTCLEHLPPSMVVHRITGDGPRKLLVAPLWSTDKKRVLNTIHKRLRERDTYQGADFT